MHLLPRWRLFSFCVTDAKTTRKQEEKKKPEDNQNREEIPQHQDEAKTSTLKTQILESTRQLCYRQNSRTS